MERAIDVMNASKGERRKDGKANPLVGAVLWKPGGKIDTACRGELRDGDHAEFTLLERKNREASLDDCVLFCTLEPCAPGARKSPKLGCAERIVLARIKEVWVGVTDPDPTVDRKGIKHLEDHGIHVQMFDRDLQELIRVANKDFIEQAEQRKRDTAKEKPIVLSAFEDSLDATEIGDLDPRALADYRRDAGIRAAVASAEFHRRLVQLGLLHAAKGKLTPTGFGLILFGKEPRIRVPQAGLLATIHHAGGGEETRDFDGPAVGVPSQVLDWLRAKLPNPIARNQARRGEANATLFELLREGIVNALVHRDYDITGAKCQLEVHHDKFVIRSPGGPLPPITIEQMERFEAPMLSRNPVLHYVFAKMQLAEERGLGLKSMRSKAAAAGLPLPSYAYRAPYMVLTVFREAMAAASSSGKSVTDRLNEAERLGWNWLASREVIRMRDYMRAINVPSRTAKNHLRKLTALGLLRKVGSGRATRYEVVRS
ncbi:MAG: hypothetical protein IT348_18845 [Candidatus Eisenbacteria bacterium]|nr:hypothetical protein [Planctomycetota bacterium]MCC6653219.1 hypothetical protein [Candidatus Eisenbacteria bacterium]